MFYVQPLSNKLLFESLGNEKFIFITIIYTSKLTLKIKFQFNLGILKLWSGFPPYYLRCGGHTVLMFMSVEWLRKTYYNLTTSSV